MFGIERKAGPEARAEAAAARGRSVPSSAYRGGTKYPDEETWTSRDAYDYALRKAFGYAADEERVAVAIYSMFSGPGDCYAALTEKGKERMRWCARAAIAALSEKS